MPKCALHPGRDSVTIVFGKNYCEKCRDGIAAARHRVDRHVEPKDCFIWCTSPMTTGSPSPEQVALTGSRIK